jgi:hypothetical protein
MQVGGRVLFTTITQVLHVPKMKNSFISISKLILKGLKVEFDKDGCKVNNAHGTVVAQTRKEKNLYLFNVNVRKESRMWQSLRMKELHFGTKDSATSTWRALRSWRKWSMA